MLGVLSAVGYGAYAVMIRVLCPRDESTMSMQLLLGYVGAFNAVVLSPIAVYVLVFPQRIPQTSNADDDAIPSSDTVQRLTLVVFGYLVAKGMMDNVLSDYLWARAVILTSATVATVGLGLTIPLAFCSDWIMGHDYVLTTTSVLGALSVLAGFVLVNLGGDKDESEGEGSVMNGEIADDDRIRDEEDEVDKAEVVFV
jgi:solute carrier family 35 protein F5